MMNITKNANETITLNNGTINVTINYPDFWAICRAGARMDVEEEARAFLADYDGIDDETRENLDQETIDQIVDEVLDTRVQNETGDQVYDAIKYVLADRT